MPLPTPPFSELGPWSDVAGYVFGSAALAVFFRFWAGRVLTPRFALMAAVLAALVHASALFTHRLELPSDIEYRLPPWAENGRAPEGFETPRNPLLTDVTQVLLPLRVEAMRRLLQRELPFWSHEMGVGQPLLGSGQAAVFSPFHLLALPYPAARAITLVAAWGLLLSLLGTYLLAREIGANSTGATLSAFAFALSTFAIAWQYHPIGLAVAHIPALGWALYRLTTTDRLALPGSALLVASFLLAGNPEPAAMALAPALVLAAFRLRRLERHERFRVAGRVILAGSLGLAISAPAWVPLCSTVPESARLAALQADPTHMSAPSVSLSELATFVHPLQSGWPVDGSWTGEGQNNWSEVASGYAGLVPLALTFASLFVRALGTRAFLAIGGAALVLALRLPVLGDFWLSLPGIPLIPLARFRWLWVLCVALSAGLAVSRFDRLSPVDRRRVAVALAVSAGLSLATVRLDSGSSSELARTALTTALTLACAFALARGLLLHRLAPAAAALLLMELGPLAVRFQPLVPATMDFRPPRAVLWLMDRMAGESGPVRISALEGRLLPYLGSLYGLSDPRGYDAMRPAAPLGILRARLGDARSTGTLIVSRDASLEMLPRLGVRYLMTGPSHELPTPWSRVYLEQWLAIWKHPNPLPLFFHPHQFVPAGSRSSALQLASWALVPTEQVAIERWRPSRRGAPVEIQRVTAVNNGFDIDVAAPDAGTLASSVAWMPGWRVESPSDAEIERVDGAFLGVRFGSGTERLELRYSPPGWHLAITLFALGAAGLALTAVRSVSGDASLRP